MRTRSAGISAASFCIALTVASCGNTLPVLESPPPPPPRSPSEAPLPATSPPPGRTIGTLPQMPVPRLAVSVFAFPASAPATEARYSAEESARLATRFEFNRVTANPLAQSIALTGDLEQATLPLATDPGAKSADVLLTGTVQPGGNLQVRLFARDTRDGRLIARSEFEGEASAAMSHAVDDAFAQLNHYWFELARGQLSQTRVEVRGFRADSGIGAFQDALARVNGVRVVRHEETRTEAEGAAAAYRVTFDGAPEAVQGGIEKLSWPSGGKAAHLERAPGTASGLAFRAVYD